MQYAVSDVSDHERYKLLISFVLPRPIAWVTTIGPSGTVNAAPFSFFNVFAEDPPLVMFAINKRPDGRLKDTWNNIERTGQFVVNLADPEGNRYLQADVQVVTRDAATLAAVEAHLPSIRNRLLLLFGQQESRQLAQRAGKERLQTAARDEVRALLKAEGGPDKVEAVIFTSLVTQ